MVGSDVFPTEIVPFKKGHVSTRSFGGVSSQIPQVVVVLPLFQMLQYPEMDDSMGADGWRDW